MNAWFVELPGDVQAQIGTLILLAVSFVLTTLVTKIPLLAFLYQYRAAIASVLTAALVAAIQNYSPDVYGTVVVLAIRLVLALVALVTSAVTGIVAFKTYKAIVARG